MKDEPNIVVLDGYTLNPGDNPWDEVKSYGKLTVYERTPPEAILERSVDADFLLTNKTPLDRGTIGQLPELKYIGVLATGYNVVDTLAAGERGIPVTNIPEYGTNSVAQYVLALTLELCHRIGDHDHAVRSGEWTESPDFCFWKSPLVELYEKTIGIIGFGRIGRRVGELAHAFGMKVLAVDIFQGSPPEYSPFSWSTLEDTIEGSDVISLNCALTADNERFVDSKLLEKMKPTAFLINAARGGLINEPDLANALNSGRIAGAALDVASTEPIRPDNPLLTAKNCLITPHIAWASLESRKRLMHTVAENIRAFLEGRDLNRVN